MFQLSNFSSFAIGGCNLYKFQNCFTKKVFCWWYDCRRCDRVRGVVHWMTRAHYAGTRSFVQYIRSPDGWIVLGV